jgi:dihydroceramide fatty acyl 2-hydroxylase
MSHLPIDASRDAAPIRLFRSDFLEFFTHVTPVAIVIVWLPVAGLFMARAYVDAQGPDATRFLPFGFLLGLFLWTFAEYTLHRFLFHYEPKTPAQERMFFLFHGVHHAQPQVKTRLVMPFPLSIPMAFIIYGILHGVVAGVLGAVRWVDPIMSGFLIGYLAYDLTHYATHHWPMRSGIAKFLKRHHMAHHYKSPDSRFGVSSPIWDFVFGTGGAS